MATGEEISFTRKYSFLYNMHFRSNTKNITCRNNHSTRTHLTTNQPTHIPHIKKNWASPAMMCRANNLIIQ